MAGDMTALAIRARSDPEAFGLLYDRCFSRVFNYIRYRIDDERVVEDLTSMVFERLLQRMPDYSPEHGQFEAWLFAMVRSIVVDYFRRQRFTGWLPWEAIQRRPAIDPAPEEVTAQRELSASLARSLPELSQRERDILGLKYMTDLNNREIASLIGLSEPNVGVILHRAICHLRGIMRIEVERPPASLAGAAQDETEAEHGS